MCYAWPIRKPQAAAVRRTNWNHPLAKERRLHYKRESKIVNYKYKLPSENGWRNDHLDTKPNQLEPNSEYILQFKTCKRNCKMKEVPKREELLEKLLEATVMNQNQIPQKSRRLNWNLTSGCWKMIVKKWYLKETEGLKVLKIRQEENDPKNDWQFK